MNIVEADSPFALLTKLQDSFNLWYGTHNTIISMTLSEEAFNKLLKEQLTCGRRYSESFITIDSTVLTFYMYNNKILIKKG